ncbi:MAG: hypothetical protein V3R90_04475 [Limibaculum sp.]
MKSRIVFIVLAAIAFGLAAPAGELQILIEKNQNSLREKLRVLRQFDTRAPILPAARLWVHKRATAQDPVVARIRDLVANLALPGGPVEFKPVQSVDVGPAASQLRFFKAVDRERAQEFADALRAQVPGLTVQDLTAPYAKVSWLQPGHFELWLAPDLH